MKNSEFHVGDIVMASPDSPFGVMKPGWVGEVIGVPVEHGVDRIYVKDFKENHGGWRHAKYFNRLCLSAAKDGSRPGISAEIKVGDMVVARQGAPCTITTNGWTGIVLRTRVSEGYDQTFRKIAQLELEVTNTPQSIEYTGWVKAEFFYHEPYKVTSEDIATKAITTKTSEKETKKMKETTKTKFKVGDMVIGNASANRYGITTEGWIGKVVEVDTDCEDGDDIRVTGPGLSGSGVHVRSSRFDLYKACKDSSLDIKDVIFNAPATIVFWGDGTKTVVRCGEGEKYDPEKGLALCIAKKALGNKHDYYEPFKKWLGKYHKKESKKASAKKPVTPTTKTKKPVAKKTAAKKTTTRKSASKK